MTITYASSSDVVTASSADPRVIFEPRYVAVLVDANAYNFVTGSLELLSDGYKLSGMTGADTAVFTRAGRIHKYYNL